MKISAAHLSGIHKTENVGKTGGAEGPRRTKIIKRFSLPEPAKTQKMLEPPPPAADLSRILSTEEKKLFELLFPVSAGQKSSGPVKAYAIQQNHGDGTGQENSSPQGGNGLNGTVPRRAKILGNFLDVRG